MNRAETPSLKPFFILWTGQAISLIGSYSVQFALVWWITELSESAWMLSLAALAGLAPPVVLGPIIGALVDRTRRRLVMFFADSISALASLVAALLFASGLAEPWHVLVLLLVRGVANAFHAPAMVATTSLMVPEDQLTRIQGLNQALQGGLQIIAAPLGAMLWAWLPMTWIVGVDVLTAIPALLPLLFLSIPEPEAIEMGTRTGLFSDIFDGLRYLTDRRGHLFLIIGAALINFCLVPAFALLPLFVSQQLEASAGTLAGLTTAFGIGMLGGGVLLGVWGGFRSRVATALMGVSLLGLASLLIGASPSGAVTIGLVALFLTGVGATFANGPIQAILQATIPPELQGRAFTSMASLAGLTAPVGLILAAPLADVLGVSAWFLAAGVLCLLMATLGALSPAIWRIETDGPDTAEPDTADYQKQPLA